MMDLKPSQIVVQTRKGTDIENSQGADISSYELNLVRDYDKKYASRVEFRTNPIAIYNCHGMIFASSRTSIHDSKEIMKIIDEDGYEEMTLKNVLPGDIVLYFDKSGDAEHSAIVISEPKMETLWIPFVISKWGRFREVCHHANQCPYSFENVKYYRIMK